ncbi:aminotransferase class IV [Acetobacter estunensis]|uniref:aminotransferase class IV n=1 Tax=Acetobacter estunensis TaxID=104097 RepID=UPI001C2DB662|nr:aminotransferase class IV [Acetobacter estunensis]MBV1836835.1 aminotransferase class IV [Acetobacter estunensis]
MTDMVWLNGHLFPAGQARIDPTDRGFLLGDGLFETMRLVGGEVPQLERHLARLESGCGVLQLPPPSRETIRQAIHALQAVCHITAGSMRLTVTRGCGPRGLLPPNPPAPTVLLTCAPHSGDVTAPLRLGISRFTRDGSAPLSSVKSLDYLPAVLARMEAVAAGFDDALLPGIGDVIAEASAATIVLLLDGELVTPLVEDGALPGISRARLLEAGLCGERTIPLARLDEVEAAWLTTALSVQAVAAIGEHELRLDAAREGALRSFLFG